MPDLDRAGVAPRQQQQLLDERGELHHLGLDVVDHVGDLGEGALRSRRSSPTLRPMTVRGVRSSWLASAAKSRWWRSEARIGTRARPGIHEAEAGGEGHRGGATETEDRDEEGEGALLRRPILDDLDHDGLVVDRDPAAQDADRGAVRGSIPEGPRRSPAPRGCRP